MHIIGDVADYLPGYQVTTVFTSAKNADSSRQLTSDFLSGYTKGVSDYNATMIAKTDGEAGINEMVELIHKYVYADRPIEKAAPSIIDGTMRLNEGAAINMASLQDQLSWFQSEGLVDGDITLDQVVDSSYVKTIG